MKVGAFGAGFVALLYIAISTSKAKAINRALFISVSFGGWFIVVNRPLHFRVITFVSLWASLGHTAGGKQEADNKSGDRVK